MKLKWWVQTFNILSQVKLKLYIKYMVSLRCQMILKAELNKLGLRYTNLHLGEVEVKAITDQQREQLKLMLRKAGLELMDDENAILVERIKNSIVEMIHYTDEVPKENLSEYLSRKLNRDYPYLATIFAEVTGINLERFSILQKIERAKELILYDGYNLTEISFMLNYSSVAHLSNQFKKVTGLTPTFYKELKQKKQATVADV